MYQLNERSLGGGVITAIVLGLSSLHPLVQGSPGVLVSLDTLVLGTVPQFSLLVFLMKSPFCW